MGAHSLCDRTSHWPETLTAYCGSRLLRERDPVNSVSQSRQPKVPNTHRCSDTTILAWRKVYQSVFFNASHAARCVARQGEAPAIIAEPLGAELLAADRQSTVSRCVRPPPCSQQF
jgi:hypothetical protein